MENYKTLIYRLNKSQQFLKKSWSLGLREKGLGTTKSRNDMRMKIFVGPI